MAAGPKTRAMALRDAIDASEEVVRLVGALAPNPRRGAAIVALALGRICAAREVDLDAVLSLVRLAHEDDDLTLGEVAGLFNDEDEVLPLTRGGRRHGRHAT